MDALNLHASIQNLPHMDKVVSTSVHQPVANLVQNVEQMSQQRAEKAERADAAANVEGKIVDPDGRNRRNPREKDMQKKTPREQKKESENHTTRGGNNGRFIDFTV